MKIIGILGMGAMGSALTRELRSVGHEIVTCVSGRSQETAARAKSAGADIVPTISDLVNRSEVMLSVVPSDQAEPLAMQVVELTGGQDLHYVDCNVLMPERTRRIATMVSESGAIFTDGSIIGPPPAPDRKSHLYLSGPHASDLHDLKTDALQVTVLGDGINQATLLKIMFSAANKGTIALLSAVMAAARNSGVEAAFVSELEAKIPGLYARYQLTEPDLADKAARWAIEMTEIESALGEIGSMGDFHAAAARFYRAMADENH